MKTAINRLLSYEQPQKYIVETENYSETFTTPVLTAGKSFILGYTNETTGVYNGKESPVIIFDDFTGDKKYVDFDFKVKSSAMKLLHKVNTNDNLKYLFYALQSIKYTPFSHKRIWISEYSNFLIEYRHPQEQSAIVLVLDGINQAIDNKKQELTSLDELVKSRFIEMFGGIHDSKKYPYKAVKELTEVISGGTPSRDVSEYWEEGTIPWIKTTELHNNVITKAEEYITEKGLNNSSAKIVPVGTVLIAMYGQGKTRGMTAYSEIKACTNQACACILPSDKINQKFLWYFFILSYDNLRDLAKGGNQPNLNGNMIKTYPILYPPRELQERFAAFVELIDKSKFIVQQQIKDLQELLDSKMDEYFR